MNDGASEIKKNTAKGQLAAAKGFANENRLLAALLERGYNASKVDLPHSKYDIIIVEKKSNDTIRVQVKTLSRSKSVSFKGGVRGGRDRVYASGEVEYRQSPQTSDIVVGVEAKRSNGDTEINFYFIPTLYIEALKQNSLSINKIPQSKNNWDILQRCKEKQFVYTFFKVLSDKVDKLS